MGHRCPVEIVVENCAIVLQFIG